MAVGVRGGRMLGCHYDNGFHCSSNVSCTLQMLRGSMGFGFRESRGDSVVRVGWGRGRPVV